MEIKKISDYEWEIPIEKGMKVPGKIFSSKKLLNQNKNDFCFEQIKRVAKLPGILKNSFVMPDFHQGYGFPIGGVAAFDKKEGVIAPEGVGYDINCGIRALMFDVKEKDFLKFKEKIIKKIQKEISLGNNRKEKSIKEIEEILKLGAKKAIKEGFGKKEDLEFCEENGQIKDANPKYVSLRAKERGKFQAGTLGSGNHFIEFGKIEKIFDKNIAKKMGLNQKFLYVLVHSGSRGLGHQVASDYIDKIRKESLNQEIAYTKINSKNGKEYLSAMNCAANFAFYNRQIITNKIDKILKEFFPKNKSFIFYDICHNIAKFEKHKIDGKEKEILVIRKGATRSFGKGRKEIPKKYRKFGEPIILPGSMGTFSYFLIGTKEAEKISFGSSAHGAGRILSRIEATNKLDSEKVLNKIKKKKIEIFYSSKKALVEEAPESYKSVEEVVKVLEKNKLIKKIAKIKPLLVIKG